MFFPSQKVPPLYILARFYKILFFAPPNVPPLYIVAPVAYQVILEPGIGQFHELESPRPPSADSNKFVGTFSCAQIGLRETRERELATLDEKIDEKWDY